MKYTIQNNTIFQINDDFTLIEIVKLNKNLNFLTQLEVLHPKKMKKDPKDPKDPKNPKVKTTTKVRASRKKKGI